MAPAKSRAQPGTGFLYGWLLVALFVEYARPASQLTFLNIPYFYSIVPMSLFLVTLFAPGLRPMREVLTDRLAKWIFIMLGLTALSVVFASVFTYSYDTFITILGYVLLFVMISRLATSEARIRGIILTLFIAHMYLLAMNPDALLNPEQRNYIDGATFLGDGNDFALSLCILLPLMVELGLSRRGIGRYLAWGGALVVVFAIIATQSRGGTLGLLAVIAYLWWRSPRKLPAALGICVLVAAALIYAPDAYFTRMRTMAASERDGSAQGRIDAWKGAIGMGIKNPILGIGTRHFGTRWGMTAHSTYFLAFAELGLPGLICVLVLIFGNIRENGRLRSRLFARAGPESEVSVGGSARLLDMLTAGMIGYAVAGAFLSAAYHPHLFLLTGLMISARVLAAQRLHGRTQRESGAYASAAAARRIS
ncbi:MAG: O-antigen ligase family protein [Steroidobacteraceae bacterium]|nr:O-antigen ligase family protein [Steroidobacteraceae bacterium]